MATIIVQGIIRDVKDLESGSTAFSLCENTGTKDNPNYIYYDCIGKVSENQRKHITDHKIVEIIGKFSSNKNVKDDKVYTNLSIYYLNIDFKGDLNKTNKDS